MSQLVRVECHRQSPPGMISFSWENPTTFLVDEFFAVLRSWGLITDCWVMSVEYFALIGISWQTKFHPVRVQMVKGTVNQRWFQSLRPEMTSEFETWVTHTLYSTVVPCQHYPHTAKEEHQLQRGKIGDDDVISRLLTWGVWTLPLKSADYQVPRESCLKSLGEGYCILVSDLIKVPNTN